MELISLYLKKYKNLEEVNIDFKNQDKNTTVFIGKNGEGKSNLLEAILKIFKELIIYSYYNNKNKFSMKFILKYKIDKIIYELNSINLEYNFKLPDHVVVYYSGFSRKIEGIYNSFITSYFDDELKYPLVDFKEDIPPILYLKNSYYPIILLTLFLSKNYLISKKNNKTFLDKFFKIEGFKSIIITTSEKRREYFLNRKNKNLINHIKTFNDIFKKENTEQKYELNENSPIIKKIVEKFHNEKEIFSFFYYLYKYQIITSIYIRIKKKNIEESFSCYDLSEGERQLITIKGLMEIIYNRETLFLMDEPDNYLHPKWQIELLPALQKYENSKTQIISTTHSPILLTRLKNESIKIIENGVINNLSINTYGKMINQTLFETMGVNERTVQKISNDISNLFQLIDENKLQEAKKCLEKLINNIGENDPDIVRAKTMIEFLESEK